MPRSRVAAVALLAGVSACRVGSVVEVVPIRGPQPEVVAVWPFIDAAEEALPGLSQAVAWRRYDVVPGEMVRALLQAAEYSGDPSDTNAIGQAVQADALLELRVLRLELEEVDVLRSARWDLEWKLVSTRGHGVQWRFEHHGVWLRRRDEAFDPTRSLEDQQDARDIVPIGGDRTPGFRNSRELMSWLHRHALEHLPLRSQP
ncbi:MAG: hypothetical protein AB8H80_08060 [Planctomycetota bacterium]